MSNKPWITEPYQIVWTDEETNLPCVMIRQSMGFWCGYVGVPKDHPLFLTEYEEIECDIDVHGGLTFSDYLSNEVVLTTWENYHQSDHYLDAWFFGFDCSHIDDLVPLSPFPRGGVYRDAEYVQKQCKLLARQLSKRK